MPNFNWHVWKQLSYLNAKAFAGKVLPSPLPLWGAAARLPLTLWNYPKVLVKKTLWSIGTIRSGANPPLPPARGFVEPSPPKAPLPTQHRSKKKLNIVVVSEHISFLGGLDFAAIVRFLWNALILVHWVLPQCIKLKPREASAAGFSVVITLVAAPKIPVISPSLARWGCRKPITEVSASPPRWGGSQCCSLPFPARPLGWELVPPGAGWGQVCLSVARC